MNPGFLIGGVPLNFGVSARLTDSSFFVIEADEYDTAFFDKRSKFVHYRPRTAVLNNLEFDHADIFPDLAAIETQFHHLVRTVPGIGRIVTNGREDALERVLTRGCWSEVERFGVQGGWEALPAEDGVPVDEQFAVYHNGERVGVVDWQVQGEHNRMNALAAIAAARHVGVPPAQAAQSLANVPQCEAPDGSARQRRRRDGLRRLRAPSHRDRHDGGRFAHARRREQHAHSGRARTALEHHEARRDESATARQPR